MRCGEKCFLVTYEIGGEQRVAPVTARTPVEARKSSAAPSEQNRVLLRLGGTQPNRLGGKTLIY